MSDQNGFKMGMRTIVGMVMGVILVVALFFLVSGIFSILAWAAPFLIVGALLVNYRTVLNFLRWIWNLLNSNLLAGALAVVLAIIGFPVVAGYLFGRSFLDRRVRQYLAEQSGESEFTEYEDVSDEPLELKQLERRENLKERR